MSPRDPRNAPRDPDYSSLIRLCRTTRKGLLQAPILRTCVGSERAGMVLSSTAEISVHLRSTWGTRRRVGLLRGPNRFDNARGCPCFALLKCASLLLLLHLPARSLVRYEKLEKAEQADAFLVHSHIESYLSIRATPPLELLNQSAPLLREVPRSQLPQLHWRSTRRPLAHRRIS